MAPAIDGLADRLDRRFASLSAEERLAELRASVDGRLVLTTSFGIEDQALTHMIATAGLDVALVTLDTGRMFSETYDVWRETERVYGLRIAAHYPDRAALEGLVAEHGINGFFESVPARHACCEVRKVVPLARALEGASAWVTGVRGSQSQNRASMAFVTHDAARGLLKVNPLLDWSREDVVAYVEANNAPINALHGRGFPSIGCAPCTRAVAPGEDERAGRWWWETSHKECGLHVDASGRLVRAAKPAIQDTPESQGLADR